MFYNNLGLIFVLIFIFLFNLVFSFGGLMLSGMIYGLSFGEARYLISHPDGSALSINLLRLYHAVSFTGYMFLPALLFTVANRSSLSTEGGFKTRLKGKFILMSLGIAITALPLVNWLDQFMRNIKWPQFIQYYADRLDSSRQEMTLNLLDMQQPQELFVCLALVALLPAIFEEILFRGIFTRIFQGITGSVVKSIMLQALVFAVLHFSHYELPGIFLMGIAAGIIAMKTGTTLYGMILHFVFNGTVVVLHYLSQINFNQTGISGAYDNIQIPWSIALVSALPFFYLLVLFGRLTRDTENDPE